MKLKKKNYRYPVTLLHFAKKEKKKIVSASSKLLRIFDTCHRLYARKFIQLNFHEMDCFARLFKNEHV